MSALHDKLNEQRKRKTFCRFCGKLRLGATINCGLCDNCAIGLSEPRMNL